MLKVSKFGGSSLATAEQVRRVCDIITADPERRLIVVSAPGKRYSQDIKVTDLLIAAASERLAGKLGASECAEAIERYRSIIAELGLPAESAEPIASNLMERLESDTTDADLYMDTMKAGGEDNCARLVAEVLQARGVEAHYVDPKDAGLLLSDEPGNAQVLPEAYGRLRSLQERPGITIFPGFFGYSKQGNIVTFSRGGSDITGAILAGAVRAGSMKTLPMSIPCSQRTRLLLKIPHLLLNSPIARCVNSLMPDSLYSTMKHSNRSIGHKCL